MTAYSKQLEIKIDNPSTLHQKLKHYLTTYHFLEDSVDDTNFVFYKKGSILDGWKINPLNWQSKLTATLDKDQCLHVHYTVPSHNVINPVVFTALYDGFLTNLEAYIVHDKAVEADNSERISGAKKNMLRYYGIMFVGVIIAFLLGTLVQEMTGNQLYGQLVSIGLALLSVRMLNTVLLHRVSK